MDLSTGHGLSKTQRQRLQHLAGRFEKAWEGVTDSADAPDLGAFLPPPEDSLRDHALHGLIQIDLAMRWRRRQPIYLEEYLERFREVGATPKLLAQLLFAEYHTRQEHGDEKPHESEYQARFPEQFAELQRLIAAQAYKTVATPSAPTVPDSSVKSAPSVVRDGILPVGEGYRLLKRIGSGSFGEVWRAAAPGGVEVAIKIIFRPLDHEEAKRELNALELIKRLHHPYLVQTQAYWPLEDRLLIVMELADGSLSGRLKECLQAGLSGIPAGELLGYFREAAEALDYLHSEHVQHRDIKPDNILLLKRHAKVADFGMARLQQSICLVNASTCGTPAYMAPEVWQGKVSPHSDQYGLAMTYIDLRLGRPPFPAPDMVQMMMDHLKNLPDLAPLAEAEQQVIFKAVAKDADQRYASCREFVESLERALAGPTLVSLPTPGVGKSPWLWSLMACALSLFLAFMAWWIFINPKPVVPFLPSGAEKRGDEVVTDLNGRKYYQRITCQLPGDKELIEFVLIAKMAKDEPDTFYIMKNKVSVGLYRKFAAANLDKLSFKNWNEKNLGDDYPAFGVGVEDAYHFAELLHGHLPKSRQWDKAAGLYQRDGRDGPYRGTWEKSPKPQIAVAGPMKVGEAVDDESPFGCRDMAGNGKEWTRDLLSGHEVPRPNAQETVTLRGQHSYDLEPLRYENIEEAGAWPYLEADQDLGFRVVIEPGP